MSILLVIAPFNKGARWLVSPPLDFSVRSTSFSEYFTNFFTTDAAGSPQIPMIPPILVSPLRQGSSGGIRLRIFELLDGRNLPTYVQPPHSTPITHLVLVIFTLL